MCNDGVDDVNAKDDIESALLIFCCCWSNVPWTDSTLPTSSPRPPASNEAASSMTPSAADQQASNEHSSKATPVGVAHTPGGPKSNAVCPQAILQAILSCSQVLLKFIECSYIALGFFLIFLNLLYSWLFVIYQVLLIPSTWIVSRFLGSWCWCWNVDSFLGLFALRSNPECGYTRLASFCWRCWLARCHEQLGDVDHHVCDWRI